MSDDTLAMRTISLAAAQRVLDAALAKATEMGKRFCICIADPAGEAVLSARMDGAPRLSARIAADKAYTVAGFGGMPTSAWWGAIENEPSLVHGITKVPRLIVFGGGVGLFSGGELVGSIGVSGGSAEEDAVVASAGAAALG
ncbi:MAG: heme-binding protein [Acidimicrobiia bacterium]